MVPVATPVADRTLWATPECGSARGAPARASTRPPQLMQRMQPRCASPTELANAPRSCRLVAPSAPRRRAPCRRTYVPSCRRSGNPTYALNGISEQSAFGQGGLPAGETITGRRPGLLGAWGSCLQTRASEESGSNVERPQPKARTNDVDAGDERRRISGGNPRPTSDDEGCEHSSDRHQGPTSGRAGRGAGCRASLRARWRMVRCGHSPDGFNHFLDRASKGVMPLGELASWLCPIRLTPPRRPWRGSAPRRRAGRSRRA
jgi:hypothetical protein